MVAPGRGENQCGGCLARTRLWDDNAVMRSFLVIALAAAGLVLAGSAAGETPSDWSHWRGPAGTGVAARSPALATEWPKEGPAKLWESEKIPRCDTDGGGGYGSVTVADGRAYLFTGWGRKETVAATQPNETPKTVPRSSDVILCLDALTGKTLWKKEFPGVWLKHMDLYHGSSSTVTIARGRCYAVGTAGVYCLDARTGAEIWKHAGPPASSSFLVVEKMAVAQLEELKAFDADTGRELWTQPKVKSHSNSPVLWHSGEKVRLICNTPYNGIMCVDPADGHVLWTRIGGGEHSTPAIEGDMMVVLAEVFGRSMVGYKLSEEKAEKVWSIAALHDQSASPVIHKGHVYAYANKTIPWGKVNRLVCAELATGKIVADEARGEAYWASPVIADGKLFFLEDKTYNAAIHLTCFDAAPEHFVQLGQAKVDCSLCVSPAIADGRLYLRMQEQVACFDLRGKTTP